MLSVAIFSFQRLRTVCQRKGIPKAGKRDVTRRINTGRWASGLINSARWDLYLTEASSGRIQFELDAIGNQWRVPFIVAYGLLQPVLPAALTYPGIPLMRAIACFRAFGWYLLFPAIIFSFFAALVNKAVRDRRILIWLGVLLLIWLP